MHEIAVFGGSAHPVLTAEVCTSLSVPQQSARLSRFANGCLEVQLQASCRERDVFIIQPLVPPVREHLVELLLMADAAWGASAARMTVVMSHNAQLVGSGLRPPRDPDCHESVIGRLRDRQDAGTSRVSLPTLCASSVAIRRPW